VVSICTRYTGPYPYWSSAAENIGAGLLFQLVKKPCGGLISCTCWELGRYPSHSALPVPQVGRFGSTSEGRTGSSPLA
jgi:hypothetical protein